MSRCDEVQLHLGGYVLHGLTVREDAWVATHLESCPVCRGEYDDLAPLLPLLALVVDAPPPAPPQLRERVVARAARRRASRARLTVFAAALLLAAAAVAVAVGVLGPPGQVPGVILTMEPGEGFGSRGEATFIDAGDLLRIELSLDQLAPLPRDAVYEAWLAVPDTEVPVSIGQFDADEQGTAVVTLTADGSMQDYTQIWVTAEPDSLDPAHDGPLVVGALLPSETDTAGTPGR